MEKIQTKFIYFPMSVSENPAAPLSGEESLFVWKKFDSLSVEKRDILVSAQMRDSVMDASREYKLSDISTATLALFIRKMFFGEVTSENLRSKMTDFLGDSNLANTLSQYILTKIAFLSSVKVTPAYAEGESLEDLVEKTSFEQYSLLQALGKFQNLGNQQITGSKISLKGQNDAVRPTIFNWLKAYRDELGVGQHDSVARGNFLFASINTKGMPSDERERLGMILKSLDENMPLSVDPGRQEIVFQSEKKELPARNLAQVEPASLKDDAERRRQSSEALSRIMQKKEGVSRPAFSSLTTPLEGNLGQYQQKALSPRPSDLPITPVKPPVEESRIELGKLSVVPGGSMVKEVPESLVPRRISFEPAKVEKFEFGGSSVSGESIPDFSESVERFGEIQNDTPLTTQNPMISKMFGSLKEESSLAVPPLLSLPDQPVSDESNVGAIVFTTKHVLPAEKEEATIQSKQKITPPDKKTSPPVVVSKPAFNIPKGAPVQAPAAPSQPSQPASSPVFNPYRISPISRDHDEDADPSSNVVNLRSDA